MRKYEVRNEDMGLTLSDDQTVSLDTGLKPSKLFDTRAEAQAAAKQLNDSDDYPGAFFVASALEIE